MDHAHSQLGSVLYKVFDGLCCQSAHPLVTLVITTFLIVVGKGGASAIYLAMGEVLNEQFGRTVLPIGESH